MKNIILFMVLTLVVGCYKIKDEEVTCELLYNEIVQQYGPADEITKRKWNNNEYWYCHHIDFNLEYTITKEGENDAYISYFREYSELVNNN